MPRDGTVHFLRRHGDVQERPPLREVAKEVPLDRLLVKPTALTSPRCPSAASATSRPSSRTPPPCWPASAAFLSNSSPNKPPAMPARCSGSPDRFPQRRIPVRRRWPARFARLLHPLVEGHYDVKTDVPSQRPAATGPCGTAIMPVRGTVAVSRGRDGTLTTVERAGQEFKGPTCWPQLATTSTCWSKSGWASTAT